MQNMITMIAFKAMQSLIRYQDIPLRQARLFCPGHYRLQQLDSQNGGQFYTLIDMSCSIKRCAHKHTQVLNRIHLDSDHKWNVINERCCAFRSSPFHTKFINICIRIMREICNYSCQ